MTLLVHSAVGTIIGGALSAHPLLAFFSSFASHFLIDMIPHGDSHVYARYKRKERVKHAIAIVVLDAAATILFILFLFNTKIFASSLSVSLAIAGGILPDVLIAITEFYKPRWLIKYHAFHFYMHNFIVHRYKFEWSQLGGLGFQAVILYFLIGRIL